MKRDYSSFCGFGNRSKKIEGAISPNMELFYLSKTSDEYGTEIKPAFRSIIGYVDEDITFDYKNDLVLYEDKAILDAYDLSNIEDLDFAKLYIVICNKDKHPDYELRLIEKEFPLDAISGPAEEPREIKKATHILCICNYKDLLKKQKTKTK